MFVVTVNMKLKTMISTFKKINITLFLGVVALVFLPGHAFAQQSVSYTVSPTIFDMTANPGQTFRSTLRIINTNKFELHVYIDINNFVPKGDDGVPEFLPLDKNSSNKTLLAEWIESDRELVIGAEQTMELPLIINVPSDASPGGHFAAVMVGTRPPADGQKETRVQTSQAISSLIFLRVTGDITEISSIRSFRTSSYFLSKPEATFEVRIENKGNVHLQPQGEIKIFNMWGQERGVIPINQQTLFGNVLPNSVRKFVFTWSSEWSFSDIGRYTAVATLAYGVDTRQFMTANTAFWIIPWKILLAFIIVIGGFMSLVSWAIKAYVRRMLVLAGVTPERMQALSVAETKGKPKTKKNIEETVKEKTKRITAPIEAGILDLRSKLQGRNNFKARFEAVVTFVKIYWKFFVVFAALLVFIALLVWFFKGAFGPARDYTVRLESEGREVTITADTPASTTTNPVSAEASTTAISIINRSGKEELTKKVSDILTAQGYTPNSTANDFGSPEEKTVIVYDAKDVDKAFAISKLLGKALLSAYSDKNTHNEIIIYIGKDAETAP